MRYLLLALTTMFASLSANAEGPSAPAALKYEVHGSCQAGDLSFSAISFFLTRAADGTQFDLILYLMDGGKASIFYRNYSGESNVIAQEFLDSTWLSIGPEVLVDKLGKITLLNAPGATRIFLKIDNSHFTKLSNVTAPGGRSQPELDAAGKTVSELCQ